MKRKSSYVGELSSGYKSDSVVEYDPAVEEGQIGKLRNDEVTKENIWKSDKRVPGLNVPAMSFKEAAIKLRRVARQLMTMEMDYREQQGVEKSASVELNVASAKDLNKLAEKIQQVGSSLTDLTVQAQSQLNHPAEPQDEPWLEESSPQLGDEEWIDIGDANFDDPRDVTGKPLPNEK